jgi:hypothetical protein
MRSIRREHLGFDFERLEGWWFHAVIKQLTGAGTKGIVGYEPLGPAVQLRRGNKADKFPVTFLGKVPADETDTETDPGLFVAQLGESGISSHRIRSAILNYYMAFEQRSAWARGNPLVSMGVEEYEGRLADEWNRYKDVVFEKRKDDSAEAGATHAD